MSDATHSKRTAITVAIIGAVGAVLAAIIIATAMYLSRPASGPIASQKPDEAKGNGEEPSAPRIVFKTLEAIPQPVNQKHYVDDLGEMHVVGSGEETSTYRIVVGNTEMNPFTLSKGEYVVESVGEPQEMGRLGSTAAFYTLIDHAGHIEVPVAIPRVGDVIAIPITAEIASDGFREITVWFRGIDRDAPMILFVHGRIRLYGEGGSVTSAPVTLELHNETQTMRTSVDGTGDGV